MRSKHDNINMIYKCNQSLNIISIVASLPASEFVNWEREEDERQEQVEECEVRGAYSTMFRRGLRVIDPK